MKKLLVVAAAVSALASANAFAQAKGDGKAAEELLAKSGCTACHSVDKKIVGPAYKEVAAKYKGDKGAEKMLFEKVKAGGQGTWGQVPMPPNSQVKDEDIKKLVKWVLSLK